MVRSRASTRPPAVGRTDACSRASSRSGWCSTRSRIDPSYFPCCGCWRIVSRARRDSWSLAARRRNFCARDRRRLPVASRSTSCRASTSRKWGLPTGNASGCGADSPAPTCRARIARAASGERTSSVPSSSGTCPRLGTNISPRTLADFWAMISHYHGQVLEQLRAGAGVRRLPYHGTRLSQSADRHVRDPPAPAVDGEHRQAGGQVTQGLRCRQRAAARAAWNREANRSHDPSESRRKLRRLRRRAGDSTPRPFAPRRHTSGLLTPVPSSISSSSAAATDWASSSSAPIHRE